MELLEIVSNVIRQNKEISRDIKPGDRLKEDLGLDSFDGLMITCDLEDKLGITLDPNELKDLKVVQDILDRLETIMLLPKGG